MDIEKTLTVNAPADRVWGLLLDPQVMGGCVPGMQSIEVISPTEYVAVIQVKIAFVSARFKLRTTIVEQRAPHYLRTEGTGEDASVASSLKQQSEIFLTETADGQTELRILVKVDVLGRLGTFGLSVMKTKADRMWDEFSQNLLARLSEGVSGQAVAAGAPAVAAPAPSPAGAPAPVPAAVSAPVSAPASAAAQPAASPAQVPSVTAPTLHVNGAPLPAAQTRQPGWLARLFGGAAASGPAIHIELRQNDRVLTVDWPVQAAAECADWLRSCVR